MTLLTIRGLTLWLELPTVALTVMLYWPAGAAAPAAVVPSQLKVVSPEACAGTTKDWMVLPRASPIETVRLVAPAGALTAPLMVPPAASVALLPGAEHRWPEERGAAGHLCRLNVGRQLGLQPLQARDLTQAFQLRQELGRIGWLQRILILQLRGDQPQEVCVGLMARLAALLLVLLVAAAAELPASGVPRRGGWLVWCSSCGALLTPYWPSFRVASIRSLEVFMTSTSF